MSVIDLSLTGAAVYDCTLFVACGAALRFGGIAERIGATILIVASGATALMFRAVVTLFGVSARYGVIAVDVAALIAFDALMIRSSLKWPIWVTGFQLAAVAVAVASLLDPVAARPYVFIQGKFAYLMLAALSVGTCQNYKVSRRASESRSS